MSTKHYINIINEHRQIKPNNNKLNINYNYAINNILTNKIYKNDSKSIKIYIDYVLYAISLLKNDHNNDIRQNMDLDNEPKRRKI